MSTGIIAGVLFFPLLLYYAYTFKYNRSIFNGTILNYPKRMAIQTRFFKFAQRNNY